MTILHRVLPTEKQLREMKRRQNLIRVWILLQIILCILAGYGILALMADR